MSDTLSIDSSPEQHWAHRFSLETLIALQREVCVWHITVHSHVHRCTVGDRCGSMSQGAVLLRSCCLTWTFILRFGSLGNILCKLSTSFALEHFLCLLTFLQQYQESKSFIKYILSRQPREARPGRNIDWHSAGCPLQVRRVSVITRLGWIHDSDWSNQKWIVKSSQIVDIFSR